MSPLDCQFLPLESNAIHSAGIPHNRGDKKLGLIHGAPSLPNSYNDLSNSYGAKRVRFGIVQFRH
jgi:hypothetical protein